MKKKVNLPAPFLKQIKFVLPKEKKTIYPFSLSIFGHTKEINLKNRVTFFVGENGSGKSTLLEAIALKCGFNIYGGSSANVYGKTESQPELAPLVDLEWLPKVTTGFFLRAESFFNFANYIDELAKEFPSTLSAYGGQSLHEQSHGEAFLSLFRHRFGGQGLYLLDEPEAALSPARQLAFLAILHEMNLAGNAQLIIATHSPIILSYPGAEIYSFDGKKIHSIIYEETEPYRLTKDFLDNPARYHRRLFEEGE